MTPRTGAAAGLSREEVRRVSSLLDSGRASSTPSAGAGRAVYRRPSWCTDPVAARAARSNRAGAALDVLADEPHVPEALLDLDTVVLLPHIASATHETREAMGELAFRNLHRFMTEGALVTPVPAGR